MFRYRSVARKLFKQKWGLTQLVQDHHVIPQQFRKHPLIRHQIHSPQNLIMMPTPLGIQKLRLRENRLVHWGPHPKYNDFVANELELLNTQEDVDDLLEYLKWELRFRDVIPWN